MVGRYFGERVNCCILALLLYTSETWTILKADRQKLQTFHLCYQRCILGIRWFDFVTNADVSARTGLTAWRHEGIEGCLPWKNISLQKPSEVSVEAYGNPGLHFLVFCWWEAAVFGFSHLLTCVTVENWLVKRLNKNQVVEVVVVVVAVVVLVQYH